MVVQGVSEADALSVISKIGRKPGGVDSGKLQYKSAILRGRSHQNISSNPADKGGISLPGRWRMGYDRIWISARFQSSDEAENHVDLRGGGFGLDNC